jgi:hypothetical protein
VKFFEGFFCAVAIIGDENQRLKMISAFVYRLFRAKQGVLPPLESQFLTTFYQFRSRHEDPACDRLVISIAPLMLTNMNQTARPADASRVLNPADRFTPVRSGTSRCGPAI